MRLKKGEGEKESKTQSPGCLGYLWGSLKAVSSFPKLHACRHVAVRSGAGHLLAWTQAQLSALKEALLSVHSPGPWSLVPGPRSQSHRIALSNFQQNP